ncbi:MAG: AP endonuclease, partial [Treponema sp.]|nr:AP endonuclease [Treponema sp.]
MKNTTPLICVPSWVIPGTYAENLNFLENKKDIRAVELLFFIYDEEVKSQFNDESEKIKEYSKRFIFTAHLPENQLQTSGPLIERLQPYVRHFIVHPLKENTAGQAKLLADWHRQYNVKFLIENTNPGLFEAFLPNLDFLDASAAGICMDTGHLLLEGKSPVEFFKTHRERIGEIHLHAVDRVQAAA